MQQGILDKLQWQIGNSRAEMGRLAASYVEGLMAEILTRQPFVRMIFAAAPSQNELLANLADSTLCDWARVQAFHMDEYIALPATAPQRFGRFLQERLFGKRQFHSVEYLGGVEYGGGSDGCNGSDDGVPDIFAECARYSALLRESPIDICCLGIGENGHLAFNDPPVADFNASVWVQPVELDTVCRNQQVNDGCFATIEDVPTHALTLTIPALMSARHLVCCVPAVTKRPAIQRLFVEKELTADFPAGILRTHPSAVLFLEPNSTPSFPIR